MGRIDKLNKWIMKLMPILSLAGGVAISGCQSNASEAPATMSGGVSQTSLNQNASSPLPSAKLMPATPELDENEGANTALQGSATVCQYELVALSKINPEKYATQKAKFESLLKSASVYSSVRDDINLQTKDIMDSLYKYKTQKICNEIEHDIHDSLISRGEGVK